MPYTVKEISQILKARDAFGLIDDKATELIARRTASTSGDMRRALDMTIQCIDHFLSSGEQDRMKLSIKDVLSFMNSLVEREGELIGTLSIHHRLIILLCPASSISALYEEYRRRMGTWMDALERSDFLDAVRLLASRDLVSLNKTKDKKAVMMSGGRGSNNKTPFSPSPQNKEWWQSVHCTGKWTKEMLDRLRDSNAVLSVLLDQSE